VSAEIPCEEGVVIAAEVLNNKNTYNQLELTSGRMALVKKGDIVVGALGHRKALFGYSGHIPEKLAVGDTLQLLNMGGVVGVCDSINASFGQPFDVRLNGVRMDVTGEPYGNGTADNYLNRASFTPAPAGRFGNLGRNSLRGPSTNQLNLGLTKNFAIWERFKAQFRTEFFNIFNTPQLTPPNTDYNNTNVTNGFGTIRSTYGFTNRQIQFGLRLEF